MKNQTVTNTTTRFSRGLLAIATTLLLLLCSLSASAQTFDVGTRSAAMGGTGTAVSKASDAMINNPAALTGAGTYDIEAGYIYRPNSHILNASVVDSKTNAKIAAGVGYSFVYGTNDLEGITAHNVRSGLAVPILGNYLSVGISGSYTWMYQDVGAKEDLEVAKGFNMGAGVKSLLFDSLYLGFSANNFIPMCKKEVCKSFFPLTLNTGIGYSIADFTIALDVDVDLKRSEKAAVDIGVGAEYIIVKMVPVRFGYRRVGFYNKNMITAGLGFTSRVVDVSVSYQGDVSHKGDHTVLATIGVKL